jgi:hypothetical protein
VQYEAWSVERGTLGARVLTAEGREAQCKCGSISGMRSAQSWPRPATTAKCAYGNVQTMLRRRAGGDYGAAGLK